ncbi:biotin--[acetyl-CoA-carboxylase] ligase [Leptothermofonsia sp. ETS-13]|uniref:biotin--[acetyl-CoA-carboxylase] ligase n=1 Tax=Leptothermofonsia sp. ETS-13 TaxID=3035696 RepID=UPI003BA358D3
MGQSLLGHSVTPSLYHSPTPHLPPPLLPVVELIPFSQQRFEAAYRIVQIADFGSASEFPAESLYWFDSLASTNQTAWELLEQGAPARTVVLALQQTAGRGQWGRQWFSPPGGLYLSVVLAPDLPVEHSAQLTLCSTWGIARVLRTIPARLSGVDVQLPVQVKWLNDLILEGRKLGGILTETRISQERITKAVVGVGLNWANPVPEPGINLKSYLERQEIPLIESLEMLAALTLHGVLSGYQRWQVEGIEALLPSYFELLAYRDRPVWLSGQIGAIVGITSRGELRVQLQPTGTSSSEPFPATSPTPPPEVLLKPGTISLGYESPSPKSGGT